MVLDQPDVFRAWSLGSLSFGVRDALPFAQFIETHAFNVRIVEKHVLVRSGVNKTEAFVRKPLDRTFSHLSHFLKKDSATLSETTRSKKDYVALYQIVAVWTSASQPRHCLALYVFNRRSPIHHRAPGSLPPQKAKKLRRPRNLGKRLRYSA